MFITALFFWLASAPSFAGTQQIIIVEDSRPTKPLIIVEDSRNPSSVLPDDVFNFLYWWRNWLLASISPTVTSD